MKSTRLAAYSLVFALGASALASGAGAPWFDDFDDYPPGPIGGQGGWVSFGEASVSPDQALTEPHALAITFFSEAARMFSGYSEGEWELRASVYVPSAMNDSQFFQLLDDYQVGQPTSWALDLEWDGAGNKVRDLESGSELPLIRDAWVELKMFIDLDDDPTGNRLDILYDGALLVSRDYSQGGFTKLDAIDVWGEDSAGFVYYDDIGFEPICTADLDDDGEIDFNDLLQVLAAWGDCAGCEEDIDGDGEVGFQDLLLMLGTWGECP